MPSYVNILQGDPAPNFHQRSLSNPRYAFDVAAGRYIVMCFFGSSADGHSQAAMDAVLHRPDLFDDEFASFFGVTIDPQDEELNRLREKYPGYRYFLDFDLSISREYGSVDVDATTLPPVSEWRRLWLVLDPTLRVMRLITFKQDRSDISQLMSYLDSLPPPSSFAGFELQAPIIVLPHVFEPNLCEQLIRLYNTNGGDDSGFMREQDGKTVLVVNHQHKRRRDFNIQDPDLKSHIQNRIHRRVVPEIAKIHQFQVTRMERYIIACYSEEDGGHFRAHRDNTTKGTAHRKFAVSINLNDDFDGGEVGFPEYGPRRFKAPAGGAVIFSCSLLHSVSKVTRGQRFAFLPFLYDDKAAEIRERNNKYLGENVGAYHGTTPEAK